MNKQKSHAFGKDCYLLGRDKYNNLLWLEAASWACDWFWGFGYVETYTNQNSPSKARDISSHTHWNSLSLHNKHHMNEILLEPVLTEKESWELADLMKSFYTLNEAAALTLKGGSHLSDRGTREYLKHDISGEINKVILPQLFEDIYKLLTPGT